MAKETEDRVYANVVFQFDAAGVALLLERTGGIEEVNRLNVGEYQVTFQTGLDTYSIDETEEVLLLCNGTFPEKVDTLGVAVVEKTSEFDYIIRAFQSGVPGDLPISFTVLRIRNWA